MLPLMQRVTVVHVLLVLCHCLWQALVRLAWVALVNQMKQ
jgi:hypothetical protein